MELIIKEFNGIILRLTVDYNATVGDLKHLISQNLNVNPSQQKLSANDGQRINLNEDSKSLSSYGLHSGSTVALLITNPGPMQVFVKNERGISSNYEVDPNETVDQLQRKIFIKERLPVNQQRLIYNGKQLEFGKKLKDYKIKNQSIIQMTLRLRG